MFTVYLDGHESSSAHLFNGVFAGESTHREHLQVSRGHDVVLQRVADFDAVVAMGLLVLLGKLLAHTCGTAQKSQMKHSKYSVF